MSLKGFFWMESLFVGQKKMYKNRSSTRGTHQNSLKSCLRTLRDVFKDMIEGFFVVKSHMGTRLEWKILLRSKNFQFLFRSKLNKSPKIISVKIGYNIPWTYVLLILKFFDPHQKSYEFKRLFLNGVFVRRPEKNRFKSAEISATSSIDVGS